MSTHLRRPRPGEASASKGFWLLRRLFLPGIPVLIFVSLMVNPVGAGWAIWLGPWLYFFETVVLVLMVWYFVKAAGQKIAARHRRAVMATEARNQ